LHWAIINNCPKLVQFLLSKGHDINHLEEGGTYSSTALHVAVLCKNHPLIQLILKNPALDLNKLNLSGDTALHIAIERRYLGGVELLHAAGADLEIVDRDGKTPLLLACYNGYEEIMEFLVRNGANVNARLPAGTWIPDVTLLHGLMWPNFERLVRLALESGADPEVRDDQHRRPIDIAFEK
ncbi:ankyrin repeat-containing domain protein, partial [Tuber borchii]